MKKTHLTLFVAAVAAVWFQTGGKLRSENTQGSPPALLPGNAPIGSVIAFAGRIDDTFEQRTGWMLCDGRTLDNSHPEFTPLFEAIAFSWGGDGTHSFNLPDLQGLFLRGVDGTAGRDPDKLTRTSENPGGHAKNQVGSVQSDELASHTHDALSTSEAEPHSHKYREPGGSGSIGASGSGFGLVDNNTQPKAGKVSTVTKVAPTGGKETRPKNAYVYWLIRFR